MEKDSDVHVVEDVEGIFLIELRLRKEEKPNEQAESTAVMKKLSNRLLTKHKTEWRSSVTSTNDRRASKKAKSAHVDDARVFGQAGFRDVASDGEAGITELLIVLHVVAPGHRHVIHNPVVSTKDKHEEDKNLVAV